MKDPEYQRPIGDDRLWLKNRDGFAYNGVEPEEFSPKDRDDELKQLKDVLFGLRCPRTTYERQWLRYMGGPQDEPEPKKIKCKKCGALFVAAGFPGVGGGPASYPTVCQLCVDEFDACGGHVWIPPVKKTRQVHTD